MRDLKINILNEEEKLIGFLIDREILSGLYITFDLIKVEKNYQNFNIDYHSKNEQGLFSVIKNIDEITILSVKLDNENHVQFIIDTNLSLKELKRTQENIIPLQFKRLIRTAYIKYYENYAHQELAS